MTNGLCINEYNDIHKLLVEFGADVNRKNRNGHTAIYYVVLNGNFDLARFLLDRGADPNTVCEADGHLSMLHVAIRHRFGAVTRLLVERGADLSAKDALGRTPMNMLEEYGDPTLKTLMEAEMGARSMLTQRSGASPAES